MVNVGDVVIRTPRTIGKNVQGELKLKRCPMKGKAIFVHPRGRFHTVAFDGPQGPVRESFLGV